MTNPVLNLKTFLSANLALGLLLSPAIALAEGTMSLKPIQETNNVYSNGNNAANANYNANNPAYNTGNATGVGVNANASLGTTANSNPNGANYSLNNTYSNDYYNNNETPSGTTLQGRLVSIPKGTMLSIHTDQPLTSFAAHVGDPVNATLENDIYVNDSVAIPAGSQVLGQIASVTPAGHIGKHGILDVHFDSVKLPDGRVVPINAHIVTKDSSGVLKGDTYAMDIAKGVGIAAGSTAVGTLMGTAAGGLLGSVGTGAVFGLGVGALGGMGYAMARKGKEVVVPAGARMSVVIDTPVTVNN